MSNSFLNKIIAFIWLFAVAFAAIQTNTNLNQPRQQYYQQGSQQAQQQSYNQQYINQNNHQQFQQLNPSEAQYQNTQSSAQIKAENDRNRQYQVQQQQFGYQQVQSQQKHKEKQQQYTPSTASKAETRTLDRFQHHYPDGSYEFRYELEDGSARYERGYFLMFNKVKTLVVVGYYSYRMSDGRYITVFYNADHNGYRQNQAITQNSYPNLPRSIDVPLVKESSDHPTQISTTTQKPFYATTRRNGRL